MNVLRCFSRVSAVVDTLQLRLLIDVLKTFGPSLQRLHRLRVTFGSRVGVI